MSRRKCPFCNKWITKDEKGAIHKKYPKRVVHETCLDEIDKEYKLQLKEEKELNDLIMCISEIHDLNYRILPNIIYRALRNLRMGENPFDTIKIPKRLQDGFEYSVIKECYVENEEKIRNILRKKDFNDVISEFKYIITVIISHLPKTQRRLRNEKLNEKRNQKRLEKLNNNQDIILETKHKPKKKKGATVDISNLLDENNDEDFMGDFEW